MDRALQSVLSWWDTVGVDVPDIKPVPRKNRSVLRPEKDMASKVEVVSKVFDPEVPATKDLAKSASNLAELKTILSDFDAGEISDHARQAVFSRGNPAADIMVIGEAPGREEDLEGKPFVGRSGQLLDKMLAAIGLTEETVYITNVINWRPPNNRNPKPEEISLCKPFIMRHIELMSPKIIVLVGGISFSALTGQTGIMKNRGQWTHLSVEGQDIPVLPIYHPAFLLRQPALKKDAWHDMLSLRARLGG